MMRILLTGATGVIGRVLLPMLREQGHEVIALVRDPAQIAGLEVDGAVTADALDPAAVRSAVGEAKPDVVVNQLTALRGLVGVGAAQALEDTARLRTEGTANLVTAARDAGVKRIVAQSIGFAAQPIGGPLVDEDAPLYLDPPDPAWARTFRAVAELERLLIGAGDIDSVVLRYGTLYGPGTAYDPDGATGTALRRGRFPLAADGAGVTSFVHLHDAALATVRAVTSDATGIYHVTDDDPATAAEWLPELARRFGGPPPRMVPLPLAERLMGWFAAFQLTRMRGASNARAAQHLDWSPTLPTWRARRT
jgi:nucleoside-diphosphate-sugar epimerase